MPAARRRARRSPARADPAAHGTSGDRVEEREPRRVRAKNSHNLQFTIENGQSDVTTRTPVCSLCQFPIVNCHLSSSFLTSFMSSHTSRFDEGLRSKYAGWNVGI